jgi:dolichyl-phosphate beta-glucosyltransferase
MQAFVVPCFNEESRFDTSGWLEFLTHFPNTFFLFVDDGSSDQTFEILSQLNNVNCQVLQLDGNVGKGEAIRKGFLYLLEIETHLDAVGFIDCDLAFAASDVTITSQLIRECEESTVAIITSRVALAGREIHRKLSRYYIGRLISTFVCWGWKDAPYDTQSGCKIFRNNLIFRRAITSKFKTRWFFDIELLLRLYSEGGKTWEVPVKHWRDVDGSKITLSKYLLILKEIILIRMILKRALENGGQDGFN